MLQNVKEQLSREKKLQLEQFARKVTILGGNFAVCDSDGNIIIDCRCGRFNTNWMQVVESFLLGLEASTQKDEQKLSLIDDRILAGVLIWDSARPELLAFIDTGCEIYNKDVKGPGISSKKLGNEYPDVYEVFSELLSLLVDKFNWETKAKKQAEKFTAELSWVYEELALIHKLSANMKVSDTDANYLQLACDSLTDIVAMEGIAVLIEKEDDNENHLVLTASSGPYEIKGQLAMVLLSRLAEQLSKGKEALLDSAVDKPFKYTWPEYIKSIIAVPLYGRERVGSGFSDGRNDINRIIGTMVGINRIGKSDFDSIDLKLFISVANDCAVFVENAKLFKDLQQLFLGSLKALTSSIDAKDQYTRGHSERVAIIAQWIAERYAEHDYLGPQQIYNIYLAGLLHDVGKIGIDESVLRKEGKLTNEEYDCIKRHSAIGASILRQIKQMRDVVPAVMYHHERVDGKGYPEGLKGDQIPLSGKMVGLADSFDAMTTARVYRVALSVEQALNEIRKGLGTQFDRKVGTIFLDSDIRQLWKIIQNQADRSDSAAVVSEYGPQLLEASIK